MNPNPNPNPFFRFSDEELSSMFVSIDEDGEGNVCFAEFAELMTNKGGDDEEVRLKHEIELRFIELNGLFDLVDADGGGSIDFDEMIQILQLLPNPNTDAGDLEILMRAIDISPGEEIKFDRWVRLMASGETDIQVQLIEQLAQFREAFLVFDRTNDGQVLTLR